MSALGHFTGVTRHGVNQKFTIGAVRKTSVGAPKCSWGVWRCCECSEPIRVSQFLYGKVRTHAGCETARTWESFDHRGLEYPPYRRTTVQV